MARSASWSSPWYKCWPSQGRTSAGGASIGLFCKNWTIDLQYRRHLSLNIGNYWKISLKHWTIFQHWKIRVSIFCALILVNRRHLSLKSLVPGAFLDWSLHPKITCPNFFPCSLPQLSRHIVSVHRPHCPMSFRLLPFGLKSHRLE